jgi:NitT/TauT family transport system substrate-binding protein
MRSRSGARRASDRCRRHTKQTAVLAALCAFLYLFQAPACLAGETEEFAVTLLPQWIPQAQFAGYMVAKDKGFYRDAGLNVTLMRGGPEHPPLELLRKGQITFCIQWLSTAVRSRVDGVPLVNIGQIVQHSALLLVAKKSSGIKTVGDLDGRNVGCWQGDFRIQPLALFRMNDLSVKLIPMYSTVNLFLRGGVSAMAAMWYNEYHTIINSGLNEDELSVFFFSKLGLNFPEDGLYCLEDTYRAHPDACARLTEASLKGWLYAFEHQDEAVDIVMKYADAASTGTNKAHQRWMLARMRDLILPDGDRAALGRLQEKDYDHLAEVLKDMNLISHKPSFKEFYRGPK